MENVTPINPRPAVALHWRVLLWVLVATTLVATFLAYGQVELLVQWVSAQLC